MAKNNRKTIASMISLVPSNRTRVLLYRKLLGYTISPKARIGLLTVINVQQVEIGHARIGKKNTFQGPFSLTIGNGTKIGESNIFECGNWILEERFKHKNFHAFITIGERVLITSRHYFDASGGFFLGDEGWVAGRDSQFWTHGANVDDNEIHIGSQSYIGSAARFAPGSHVGKNVVIGLGSVVTGRIEEDNCLIAGCPAKIVKNNYNWRHHNSIPRENAKSL